jgi:hypothetical protein
MLSPPLCKVRGSHGSGYKDYGLLGMTPCSLVDTYQHFRGTAAAIFRVELLYSWQTACSSKIWYLSTKLYGAISRTTAPCTSPCAILMWHHYSEGIPTSGKCGFHTICSNDVTNTETTDKLTMWLCPFLSANSKAPCYNADFSTIIVILAFGHCNIPLDAMSNILRFLVYTFTFLIPAQVQLSFPNWLGLYRWQWIYTLPITLVALKIQATLPMNLPYHLPRI